jgi:hypothetical protein
MNNQNTFISQSLPQRRQYTSQSVGNELMITEPESGKVHFFNATAAIVWECCDGRTSFAECEKRLRERFSVPDSVDLATDIRTIVHNFSERGLIEA